MKNFKKPVGVPATISSQAQALYGVLEPISLSELDAESVASLRRNFQELTTKSLPGLRDMWGGDVKQGDISGVPVTLCTPRDYDPVHDTRTAIYLHAGGWIIGQAETGLLYVFANLLGLKVLAVEYRLAPDFPFPAALDDCFSVYQDLLQTFDPKNVAIIGDSAGGHLALTTTLKARASGLPMPAALGLMSPPVDLSGRGDSLTAHEGLDPFLSWEGLGAITFRAYAAGHDQNDPLLSPIYADYNRGFPATIITTGTRNLMLSESVRLQRALKRAGAEVELSVWEGMWHGFEAFPIPEAEESCRDIANFVTARLGIPDTQPSV